MDALTRIKRITSHSGHARFLAETADEPVGYIPRQDIPSPYHSSPTHLVHDWNERRVVVVETSHRRFDVFEVPAGMTVYKDEEPAIEITIAAIRAKQAGAQSSH